MIPVVIMADPLSLIAGVISVATVAVQPAKALSKLIDDIKGTPREIQAVAHDIHAFRSIVSSLRIALEERDIKKAISGDAALIEMIGSLHHPLSNCERALQNLMSKMRSEFQRSDGSAFRANA